MSGPDLSRFRHIAIEGAIGAGKTSLAKLLAERIGGDLLLENPGENPFLDRFYADMEGYAFQTQLFFLFQRQKQVQSVAQPSVFGSPVVSDFMLAKDALFARLTLGDDEHRLYAPMYAQVASQVREPDLVLWLRASPATLVERVRRRGIAMEQGIEAGYLDRLSDAYADWFASYDGAPVFAVDTERLDPVGRTADLDRLVDALARFDGRRGELPAATGVAPSPHEMLS